MIILDEQLLGRDLEISIAHWYQGAIAFITDLRPATVIKDDGIHKILRQQNQPTFVTINEKDFWRKIPIDSQFCVICFALPDSKAREIPAALRSILHCPIFHTKADRMGKVARITNDELLYYTFKSRQIHRLQLTGKQWQPD